MKKILVGVDGSEHASKALDLAIDVARKFEAELLIVHVAGPNSSSAIGGRLPCVQGDELLSSSKARAQCTGLNRVSAVCMTGDPGMRILKVAKDWSADMIVLGSRGFGELKASRLGSVAQKIALVAHCHVLIAH